MDRVELFHERCEACKEAEMVEVLAKVRLTNISGLPEDACYNDFAFDAASLAEATLDGIAASIASFYNTTNTTDDLSAYLSDVLSRVASANEVAFYDVSAHLDGSPAGSPVYVVPWTLVAGAVGDNWPSEVAMKSTVYADGYDGVPETANNPTPPPATIRPRARYRGGIFLGPLCAAASTNEATAEPRPSTDFLVDLAVAWDRFMDERGGDFCIWSRADEVFRLVAPGGQITADNAFDTIRKRGGGPTARSLLWP